MRQSVKTCLYRASAILAVAGLSGLAPQIATADAPQIAAPSHNSTSVPAAGGTVSLQLAIRDLMETFGKKYSNGEAYLARLDTLAGRTGPEAEAAWKKLRSEALLANPLLDFDRLLVVRSRGFDVPANYRSNMHLRPTGHHAEIAVLSPAPSASGMGPDGTFRSVYRPPHADGPYVGQVDLHWDADRMLFTSTAAASGEGRQRGGLGRWTIFEIGVDGTGLRRVMRDQPDDLPNGKIVFGSTGPFQGIPCQNGKDIACSLYLMDAGGQDVRRLCYDQDNDLYPAVLSDGQVIYSRWDYTGIRHEFLRPLMVMNPDGTGQRAIYGSNSCGDRSHHQVGPAAPRTAGVVWRPG